MSLESKKTILFWLSIILPVIVAIIYGLIKYQQNSVSSKIQSNKDAGQKEKDIEQDNRLSTVEEQLLGISQFIFEKEKSAYDIDDFKTYLKTKFNLSYEEFNEILVKAKTQEKALLEKALSLFISEEYSESALVFKQILNNSDKLSEIAIGNSYLGSIYLMNAGEFDENPEEYLLEAEKLFETIKINDENIQKIKALNYDELGILYKKKKELEISLKYYKKAISEFDDLQKKHPGKYIINLGLINHNIYVLYSSFQQENNGFDYLLTAYELKRKAFEKNPQFLSTYLNTLISMGNHYSANHQFEEAEKHFQDSFTLISNNDEPVRKAQLHMSYANSLKTEAHKLKSSKLISESIHYFLLAEKEFSKLILNGNKDLNISYSDCLYNLGLVFKTVAEFKKSEEHLLKALKLKIPITKSFPGTQTIALGHIYFVLAQSYDANLNKPKKAVNNAEKAKICYKPYKEKDSRLKGYIEICDDIIKRNS